MLSFNISLPLPVLTPIVLQPDFTDAYYNLGYNFKNFEFNQSNVELFERQVESDRARLERGEIKIQNN